MRAAASGQDSTPTPLCFHHPDDSSSSASTPPSIDSGNKGPRAPAPDAAPSVADRDDSGESGSWLDRNRDDLITYGAALLISLGIRT